MQFIGRSQENPLKSTEMGKKKFEHGMTDARGDKFKGNRGVNRTIGDQRSESVLIGRHSYSVIKDLTAERTRKFDGNERVSVKRSERDLSRPDPKKVDKSKDPIKQLRPIVTRNSQNCSDCEMGQKGQQSTGNRGESPVKKIQVEGFRWVSPYEVDSKRPPLRNTDLLQNSVMDHFTSTSDTKVDKGKMQKKEDSNPGSSDSSAVEHAEMRLQLELGGAHNSEIDFDEPRQKSATTLCQKLGLPTDSIPFHYLPVPSQDVGPGGGKQMPCGGWVVGEASGEHGPEPPPQPEDAHPDFSETNMNFLTLINTFNEFKGRLHPDDIHECFAEFMKYGQVADLRNFICEKLDEDLSIKSKTGDSVKKLDLSQMVQPSESIPFQTVHKCKPELCLPCVHEDSLPDSLWNIPQNLIEGQCWKLHEHRPGLKDMIEVINQNTPTIHMMDSTPNLYEIKAKPEVCDHPLPQDVSPCPSTPTQDPLKFHWEFNDLVKFVVAKTEKGEPTKKRICHCGLQCKGDCLRELLIQKGSDILTIEDYYKTKRILATSKLFKALEGTSVDQAVFDSEINSGSGYFWDWFMRQTELKNKYEEGAKWLSPPYHKVIRLNRAQLLDPELHWQQSKLDAASNYEVFEKNRSRLVHEIKQHFTRCAILFEGKRAQQLISVDPSHLVYFMWAFGFVDEKACALIELTDSGFVTSLFMSCDHCIDQCKVEAKCEELSKSKYKVDAVKNINKLDDALKELDHLLFLTLPILSSNKFEIRNPGPECKLTTVCKSLPGDDCDRCAGKSTCCSMSVNCTTPTYLIQERYNVDDTLLKHIIDHLRMFKTDEELDLIKYANRLASFGHRYIMKEMQMNCCEMTTNSMFKVFTQAQVLNNGHLSYTPKCSSMPEAITKEIEERKKRISPHLCCFSNSCYFRGYASDVATTFPIDGQFTYKEKCIYSCVLAMRNDLMQMIKPGVSFSDLQTQGYFSLVSMLRACDILSGDPRKMVKAGIGSYFLPCPVAHFIGVEVNDVNILKHKQKIQAGMVLAIEPACVFNESLVKKMKCKRGLRRYLNLEMIRDYMDIGIIQIGENVYVTPNGIEMLTDIPRGMEEICEYIQN